jgi:hypothetical protein
MSKDLKARIAEEWAMLDPVDPLRRLLSDVIDVLSQPAQEPVAWLVEFENGEQELHFNDTKKPLGEAQTPLYTAPQPRPWVGLTDEEIRAMCKQPWVVDTVKQWAEIIESKLKEKNTP